MMSYPVGTVMSGSLSNTKYCELRSSFVNEVVEFWSSLIGISQWVSHLVRTAYNDALPRRRIIQTTSHSPDLSRFTPDRVEHKGSTRAFSGSAQGVLRHGERCASDTDSGREAS